MRDKATGVPRWPLFEVVIRDDRKFSPSLQPFYNLGWQYGKLRGEKAMQILHFSHIKERLVHDRSSVDTLYQLRMHFMEGCWVSLEIFGQTDFFSFLVFSNPYKDRWHDSISEGLSLLPFYFGKSNLSLGQEKVAVAVLINSTDVLFLFVW